MDNIIISPNRLLKIASKWQKRDALGRNKNSSSRKVANNLMNSMVGENGTFVIYTIDNTIFQELFKMSEEEFGLSTSSRPIVLPCDSLVMNYVVSLLQGGMITDLDRALQAKSLISSSCLSSALHQGQTSNPTIPLWLLLSS
ncbi:hypothetical protein L3X38_037800 [Prunus dulcis]|uniref:SAUR-like auxin-responsive protein family n=1 Tax=Prunus dulcis TaxID=3755 RepID=A0AAD4V667_PRUDU|nr:hypothetical protein L3X38_037800 [Prunus dulcis]